MIPMTSGRARYKNVTIIIPTKNRCESLSALIGSLKKVRGVRDQNLEVIVGDNDSSDDTWKMLQREAAKFPGAFRAIKVLRPGKSAVLNEAIQLASGDVCVFLDDDVVVDPDWLEAIHRYFASGHYAVAQGVVWLPSPESEDPEILRLLERYRTISVNKRVTPVETVGSLNGANMAIERRVFDQVGGFDERLGPGVSGTSEDTELGERIANANIQIGYMEEAVVFHRVERERLTESYFKLHHRLQGRSRFVYKQPGMTRILVGLLRAVIQFGVHSLTGKERRKYRGKGRVFHYDAMLAAKLQQLVGSRKREPETL